MESPINSRSIIGSKNALELDASFPPDSKAGGLLVQRRTTGEGSDRRSKVVSEKSDDLSPEKVSIARILAMASVKFVYGAVNLTILLTILPIVVDHVMPHSVNLGIG